MIRILVLLTGLALLAGCAAPVNLDDEPPAPLGAFKLGHNVVIASKMQKGPLSREASAEEWTAALTSAVAERFGRYDGTQLYHFGISVEGYMLAKPGVPFLYKPRSALIINVTVWDDAAGVKLNEEPYRITALESTSGKSFLIGSGLGRSREEQLSGLSFNAVRRIEEWLAEQNETQGWFAPRPDAAVSEGGDSALPDTAALPAQGG